MTAAQKGGKQRGVARALPSVGAASLTYRAKTEVAWSLFRFRCVSHDTGR